MSTEIEKKLSAESLPVSAGETWPIEKVQKIVTAIYMVTEYMDKNEPLRTEVRKLAVDLMLDGQKSKSLGDKNNRDFSKAKQVISLLEIASSIGLVSSMNHSILKKELSSLDEFVPKEDVLVENILTTESPKPLKPLKTIKPFDVYKGQKGINDDVLYSDLSFKAMMEPEPKIIKRTKNITLGSKSDRREEIYNFIKDKNGVTIKDIFELMGEYGEKTIQREILALVKEGLVIKIGEKRWSRYYPSESMGM